MGYKVTVDGDICISSGRCVAELPRVFRFDDEEIAELQDDPVLPTDKELVAIARACPSGAIALHSDGVAVDAGLNNR